MYFGPDARLSYILLWVTSSSLDSILKSNGSSPASYTAGLWLLALPKRLETPVQHGTSTQRVDTMLTQRMHPFVCLLGRRGELMQSSHSIL